MAQKEVFCVPLIVLGIGFCVVPWILSPEATKQKMVDQSERSQFLRESERSADDSLLRAEVQINRSELALLRVQTASCLIPRDVETHHPALLYAGQLFTNEQGDPMAGQSVCDPFGNTGETDSNGIISNVASASTKDLDAYLEHYSKLQTLGGKNE